jgi:quercetin dioxygenase-like cupin family protein
MKVRLSLIAIICLVAVSVAFAQMDKSKGAQHPDMGGHAAHVMLTPDDVKWGPAPPALPPGAQVALMTGDPTKAGAEYTIRAKFPDGYRVPPHWHPVTENVTVLKGSLYVGLGEKFDQSASHQMTPGSFASMPTGVRHFAWAKGETIIQIHGVGPFEVVYVNPADDPRNASSAK